MSIRIVVVGGGYAGLAALGVLKDLPDAEVILIDPNFGHELIPELPEALRKDDTVHEHIVAFEDLLSGTGIRHIPAAMTGLSVKPKLLELSDGTQEPFDWLILSPGSLPFFPSIPGLKEAALPLRNVYDTQKIKDTLRYAKEQRIVIVGGGLTGVEVAGTLAPDHEVWLIEGAKSLLPALGHGLAQYARNRLQTAGVKVVMGQKLLRVSNGNLELERDRLHYDTLIWAGGIAPPDWIKNSPLPLDGKGYPIADAYGEVLPQIFAAGDLWHVVVDGQDIPATAQVAALAGSFVGQTIARRIQTGDPGPSFSPQIRGMLISLDPGKGVGWVLRGGIPIRGYGARTLKNLSFREYRLKLSKVFNRGWPF